MSMITRLFVCALMLVTCSCASRVGGVYLYDRDVEPPTLHDGEIRIETFRRVRGKRMPDVRILRCRDGVVTGIVESRRAGERGEKELGVPVWADAWDEYLWPGAFDYQAEEPDPKGSYYHYVTLRLGTRTNQFSAQLVPSLFSGVVKSRGERTDTVNSMVKLLDQLVPVSPWEPPAAEE